MHGLYLAQAKPLEGDPVIAPSHPDIVRTYGFQVGSPLL
jgi:hypothetical protein